MPKKIIIIDDCTGDVRQARWIFKDTSHAIVTVLWNMEEAIEAIEAGLPEADIVLLDGNLTPESRRGDDGEKLASLIREKYPKLKIIEYTSWHEPRGYGDRYVMKSNEEALLSAIDSL